MAEYQTLIIAVASALSSGVGVGITLKTDVKWMLLMMEKMDERLTRLENKSPQSELTPNSWTPIIGGLFMSKYSRELKCIIAKQYLDGTSSLYLAKQYSISSRQIRYWAQVFAIHDT
ncbi:hypothetical protein, partial [Vibrio minamisatsumaniensis]|uniref:hypothetical protein n=1 Tax=Vibrio minamisatsumaniensis TaxID=2910243 RepID=UPI003D1F1BC7